VQLGSIIIFLLPSLLSLLSLFLVKIKGTDHFYHEAIITAIKSNDKKFIKENPFIIGPNIMAYPQLLHWFLSFFNNKHISKYAFYINIFSTIGSSISLLWFLQALFRGGYLIKADDSIYFLTGLAYAVFPSNYDMVNAKNTGISARGIGLFMGQLYLYFICYYALNHSIAILLFAIPVCIVILLSSTFAIQFILFFTPIIAVVTKDFFLLVPLAAALLIFFITSPSFFVNFFKGQYNHKYLYSKYLAQRYILASRFSIWRDLFYDFWVKLANKNLTTVEKLKYITSNSIFTVLISMPLVVFGLFCIITIPDIPLFLTYFSLVCVSTFIITSFRPTRFLGEPERYLEFGIGFFCIIATIGSYHYHLTFQLIIYYSIFFVWLRLMFYIYYIRKNKNVHKRNLALEAKLTIEEIDFKKPKNILSNSTQISKILLSSKWQVFWHPLYQPNVGSYHFIDLFSESYDYIAEQKLINIIKEFEINFFLCDCSFLRSKDVFLNNLKTKISIKEINRYGDDLILFETCPKN
jgi:hypothetical protein